MAHVAPLRSAIADLIEAWRRRHLWMALGTFDIKHRYKRSIIGPFWMTLNLAALILGIGLIYGSVLNAIHSSYVPYLAVGIVLWTFISSTLIEGASVFIFEASLLKGTTLSKIAYVFRSVWRSLWVLAHNLLILLPIFLFYRVYPGIGGMLIAAAGLVLITLLLAASSLLLAVLGARFRDVPPAVTALIQPIFFATPIIWEAEALHEHRWIMDYNPMYHVIETVRAPLLGQTVPLTSFAVTAGMTAIVALLAIGVYAKARRKLVFWL